MKIKTTIYIHYNQYTWEEKSEYLVFSHKMDDCEYRTYICEQEIEIEVPDNYNPTAQKLAALQEEKEKAQKEFSKKVASINERISKLQAIEYTA